MHTSQICVLTVQAIIVLKDLTFGPELHVPITMADFYEFFRDAVSDLEEDPSFFLKRLRNICGLFDCCTDAILFDSSASALLD